MKRLRDQVKRIGPTDVSILISGESGTGKEAVTRAIHKVSYVLTNRLCRLIAEL